MSHKNPRSAADRPPPKTAVNLPPQNPNKTNGLLSSRIHRTLSRLLGLALTLTALSVLPGTVAPAAAQITGITITTSPTSVLENDMPTSVTVTATLQGSGTYDTDKNFNLTIGLEHPFLSDATLGTDYTLDRTTKTITLPANASSVTTTITVTAKIDGIVEGNEYFGVGVTNPPNSNSISAWPYIKDSVPYALSVSKDLLNESQGSTEITITATKTSGTAPTTDTTVTLALGGTAVRDTDYTSTLDTTNNTFTISANANSDTGTLTIDPTSDSTLAECGETIVVSGTTDTTIIITPTTILLNDEKSRASPTPASSTPMCSTPANPLPRRSICRPPPLRVRPSPCPTRQTTPAPPG